MTKQLKLLTNEWQRYPQHLNFLLTFLLPRRRDKHPTDIDWFDDLGEPPSRAVDRFIAMGAVTHVTNVAIAMDEKFTVAELRAMLKQYDKSGQGNKSDLIIRLLQIDYAAMEKATADVDLLQCTETGEKITRNYAQLLSELQNVTDPSEYETALNTALSQSPLTITVQKNDSRDVTESTAPETEEFAKKQGSTLLQTTRKVLKCVASTGRKRLPFVIGRLVSHAVLSGYSPRQNGRKLRVVAHFFSGQIRLARNAIRLTRLMAAA